MSLKKKVVWLPYDMDTAIGINNEGQLVFNYELEDIDHQQNGENIFNGQNSVIWRNIREVFPKELKAMYQTLRSNGVLSYQRVEEMFENHQSAWSESIFNEDARFKYIDPFVLDNRNYLGMLLGSKAEQRKWWLYNRFKYMDSKYIAGDARIDTITIRPYAADNISITSYADIYATVAWDANITQERCLRNTTVTLQCPYTSMNDNVVTIYSASQIASIGDVSGLQVGVIDVSNAIRIQNIKVGDSDSNYDNTNLRSLTLGNNVLLQTLDVRNCSGLGNTSLKGHIQQAVDISGCSIIENVYFSGTNITGITFPNGGVIKNISLPETITNLTILNQPSIQTFTMDGNDYSNISTLRIENCSSAIPVLSILSEIPANSRVRIIGLTFAVNSTQDVEDFYDHLDTMRGLDENGNNLDNAVVSGTITGLDSISGTWVAEMQSRYPDIQIEYNHIVSNLYYYNYDGSVLLDTEIIYDGGNGTKINNITRPADKRYIYTPNGWSKVANGSPDANALVNIVADRIVYAAYDAEGQKYRVRFYNGNTLLKTVNNVLYGGTALYNGETPVHTTDPDHNVFNGWSPSNKNITGDTDCYAQYIFTGIVARNLINKMLIGAYSNDRVTSIGNYAFKNFSSLTTVEFPAVTLIGDEAFQSCANLTTVNFPVATSIGMSAFRNTKILTVEFPAVTLIGNSVFSGCTSLTTVEFPVVTSISNNAFSYCRDLAAVNFPVATSIGMSAFWNCSSLTTVEFPAVTSIGSEAFRSCTDLIVIDFPVATSIGDNAFWNCSSLTTLILRNTQQIVTLSATNILDGANNCIIYVPDALVEDYKAASNWSIFADRLKGLSELP